MISLETQKNKSKFRILFCDRWSITQDIINFTLESCGNGSGKPTWLELVFLKGKCIGMKSHVTAKTFQILNQICWYMICWHLNNFPRSYHNNITWYIGCFDVEKFWLIMVSLLMGQVVFLVQVIILLFKI